MLEKASVWEEPMLSSHRESGCPGLAHRQGGVRPGMYDIHISRSMPRWLLGWGWDHELTKGSHILGI